MSAFTAFLDELRARWRSPRSFTAMMPVAGVSEDALRQRLLALDGDFVTRLGSVPGLHFLRLVAVPAEDGQGARLLLNAVHDQTADAFLAALGEHAGDLLAKALEGPAFAGVLPELGAFLQAHRVRENTFFIAAIGHSRERILAENAIRVALEDLIDRQTASITGAQHQSVEQLRQQLRAEILRHFPLPPVDRRGLDAAVLRLLDLLFKFIFFPLIGVAAYDMMEAIGRIRSRLWRAAARIGSAFWWLYGGIFTAAAFVLNRILEKVEPDDAAPEPSAAHLAYLEAAEDRVPRNELTGWFPVKKSWLGRWVLRALLYGSECGARHFWTDGRLTGAQNIHFARLLLIDQGRTMIFMSDYEGSFNGYLDHFVGVGGHTRAVVPIWSRLHGCPKTRWLYQQVNPPVFRRRWKSLVRLCQLKATVWYSAYPSLSANDILANARICSGLFAETLDEADALAWSRLL